MDFYPDRAGLRACYAGSDKVFWRHETRRHHSGHSWLGRGIGGVGGQYGLLSADFYHCFRAGELGQTQDFIRWAGFYEAKLEREARYRQLAYEHLRELRRLSGLGALELSRAGS